MKFKTLLWSIMTVLAFSVTAVGCSDDDDVKPAPAPGPDSSDKVPVLALSGSTLEMAAEGGEASMAFTVENPVEGVTPKASCGSGWLQNINAELNGDKGRVVFTATKNEGEAREATVTLRYQGAESVNFTVKQVAAGTKPEPEPDPEQPGEGPKVEISATYDEGQKVLLVDMICTSKNADKALFAVVPATAIDESVSLEEFMESPQSFAKTLSDEKLAALNGEGIKNEPAVTWEPDMDGMQVAAIVLAKNANGKTVARADAQLGNGGAQPPIPGDGPQVSFSGYIGDYEVLFHAKSATKNVASGEIIVMLKEEFDGILAGVNNDFNKAADKLAGQGQALKPVWCEQINSDNGMEFYISCGDPTIILSAMLLVYDADHHRTVAYTVADKEQTPSENSDTGKIEMDFQTEVSSNTYRLTVYCTTKNSTEGWLAWRHTDAFEEMMSKNNGSLEATMDELKTMKDNSQKFEDFWVRNANKPGKGLVMTLEARPGEKMTFLVELSNRDGRLVKRADCVAKDPYQGKSEVKALDDQKFSDLVWDYKANPSQFTFKGNRPCVLDFGAPAWCGWCQELEPVMAQLSAEFKDQVDFYTIDTDYHKGAYRCFKSLFRTDGIPVLAVVDRNGNCKVIGGYLPADKLRIQIKIALNAKTSRTVTAMPAQDLPCNYVSLASFNPVKKMMDRCLF